MKVLYNISFIKTLNYDTDYQNNIWFILNETSEKELMVRSLQHIYNFLLIHLILI